MKKILTLTLAFVMIFLLTACNENASVPTSGTDGTGITSNDYEKSDASQTEGSRRHSAAQPSTYIQPQAATKPRAVQTRLSKPSRTPLKN